MENPQMVNKNIIYCILLSLTLPLFAGCGGDEAPRDLQNYVSSIKQKAKVSSSKHPTSSIKAPEPAIYLAEPLRAPFDREEVAQKEKKVAASPLQAYPISVLKLVGTITEGSVTYAYVVAPDQITYKVSQGDKIGDRDGVVTSVQPGRVNVMEMDTDSEVGKTPMRRVTSLELKDAQ